MPFIVRRLELARGDVPDREVMPRPLEPKLHAAIAVVNQVVRVEASAERLFERVQSESTPQRFRDPSPDDLAGEDIGDERDVDKP